MDMKQEIFMRLVVEQCDPHAMGWNFSDLYQLACDAEKYYQQKELERTRKALDEISEREKMEQRNERGD